ncbi:MAG: hypothetical protein BGO43_04165 [Gammaproteobacteria bacterium 39-13]|nr:hypothetical protein [Gammaproteobacteria bacterium]OJV94885.1 MAG: hypothetical protein BGO43_04165 [Gammaproteobacteria bacterium 39-13]
MKPYYAISEIKDKNELLSEIFHRLVHEISDPVYVFVAKPSTFLDASIYAFLEVPREQIQYMEMENRRGLTTFEFQIRHSPIIKQVGVNKFYLSRSEDIALMTEEDFQECNARSILDVNGKPYSPQDLFFLERSELTNSKVTSDGLYLMSNSVIANEYLNRNPAEKSTTAPLYLDESHEAYSTELAAAVTTWIDIHVNGQGKKSHTFVERAKDLLNKYSDKIDKTPRNRIASWINPDNCKKKHKQKN